MSTDPELDPLFDVSLQAKGRRFFKSLLSSQFFLIALMIHLLILILFGSKILFEAYQQVNLESSTLIAPHSGPPSPPPASSEAKSYDVKVAIPQDSKLTNKLAINKLSNEFNVATPEIRSSVSGSFEGMGSMGGGGGNGTGDGFAKVNFFGVQANINNIVFLLDTSLSMNGKKAYAKIEDELSKAIKGLNSQNKFNVFVFNSDTESVFPNMTSATEDAKKKAIDFFLERSPLRRGKNPPGGTRPDLCLQTALKWKPEMIMLLSDTAKTWSTKVEPLELLRLTREEWNNNKSTKINTICFDPGGGVKPALAWMQDLAKQNGGKCAEYEY